MYHHVVAPVVDTVIGAVASMVHENAKSMARRDAVIAEGAHAMGFGPKPLNTPEEAARNIDLGGAVLKEQATAALRPVVETVQSSIELATGSKRAGEVLTEPALMALTEGAFRLAKPALTVAKTGLKTAATALRNLEVTVDSAAFLRHNTGVPFDAVKIGTKAPPAAISSERIVNVPKQESPIWREFKSHKETVKTNGAVGKRKEYYEWDYTHNDIEVYDYKGHHLGSKNPVTGEIYKGPVRGRHIKEKVL